MAARFTEELNFDNQAGFVEYLRWMRPPEPEVKSDDRTQQKITKESQASNNADQSQSVANHYY
jgi:hypothetical protein